MRVCPYTYCSLNGHAHAPAVPLRSFLASRRRLIKTQQSMKLRGISAFRKRPGDKTGGTGGGAAAKVAPLIDEEAVGDFFVEVYAGPRVSTDMSCSSDVSVDEMDTTVRKMEFLVFDRCGADEDGETGKDLSVCGDGGERDQKLEEKHGAYRDGSPVCSDAASSGDFVEELPWIRYHGYEDDSLDDGISEEQRIRDDEVEGAENFVRQERDSEEGTSGRLGDVCEEAAGEQEANDEENISNSIHESEIDTEQEGVGCRVEACQELDGRDEDNILDTVCHEEPSAGRRTAEEKLSDDVCKLEVPDEEVAGSADESCEEDISADREAEDECSVESDDDFGEEQDVKAEEDMPDDGSEMDISEEDISGDGCIEDFSDEVSSRAVPEDGSIANTLFEQYVSTVDDVFEQDSPSNGQSNGQEELCVTGRKLEADTEETVVAQPIDHENTVDGMEDSRKESETTTYILEQPSEESGITQESNPMSTDGAQMEPEIATCESMDAPEESGVTQESSLDDDAEYVTDAADMGPESTRCKLEDASEESCFDQETVEADDSACVSEETGIGHDTVEGDDSAYVTDDAQNDSEITKCKSEDVSNESITSQGSTNISSDAQNESEPTASELAVIAASEDTEIESKLTTCKSEDVSEETVIAQEADHDDSSAYVKKGAQNESAVTIYESEGAQEESVVVKEDEDEDNSSGDAQFKPETAACESVSSSEKTAMSQESDGHANSTDGSDNAQKDVTMPNLVACDVTEETNQSFNVQIPEHKYDCSAEDHVETQNIPAEQTDVKEPSIDDICDAFSGLNLKGDVYFDPSESDTCLRNKLIISRRRRTPEEEEYMRGFNPRAPNFLPLELDPDAEKVDLKHQMVDDRKNAEEWMIDYALRRAVTNLAPARKKKVELLVQAFETVLPHDEENKKSMTPPRPVQACN